MPTEEIDMSFLDRLKEYAPDILATVTSGGALLPAILARRVSEALGVEVKSSKDLESAVESASPDQLLELRRVNYKHQIDVMRLELEQKQAELEDSKAQHHETQETIRSGDTSLDKAIRMVRPTMAKQSFYASGAYVFVAIAWEMMTSLPAHPVGGAVVAHVPGIDVLNIDLLTMMLSPAWVYMGLRTADKGMQVVHSAKVGIDKFRGLAV